MKRTSKPPPLPNAPRESTRDLGAVPAFPPNRSLSPYKVPAVPQPPQSRPGRPSPLVEPHPADDEEGADPATVEVSPEELKRAHQRAAERELREQQQQQQQQASYPAHLHRPHDPPMLDLHRAPDPTMPLTPAIEWEPIGPPTPPQAAAAPRALGGYESSLREQILSGISAPPPSRPSGQSPMLAPLIAPPPASTPRGSQARLSTAGPAAGAAVPTHVSGQLSEAWASAPSGSYSTSGQREIASKPGSASASRPRPGDRRESMPIGYVIASAFFLAIAVVGFGLYLAFEVISL